MMSLVVNVNSNEDIGYISDHIADALGGEIVYYTHRNSVCSDLPVSYKRYFLPGKTASLKQLVNVFLLFFLIPNILKSNVVYITSPSPVNIFLCVLCRVFNRKCISFVHDVKPHYSGVRGTLYRIQNDLIFNVCYKVFVFSEASARHANNIYGNSSVDIEVLPLPSPVESFCNNFGNELDGDSFDFVWWGRAEEYKGWRKLPEFARKIDNEGKKLLVLSSCTHDSEFFLSLSGFGNVKFINSYLNMDVLVDYLMRSKVNICPYESATQSGIVAFCSCVGLPTIAHDVDGLSNQIADGVNGFLVDDILNMDVKLYLDKCESIDKEIIREFYRNNFGVLKMKNTIRSKI